MLDKPETNELDRLDRFAAGGDAPATDATEADAPSDAGQRPDLLRHRRFISRRSRLRRPHSQGGRRPTRRLTRTIQCSGPRYACVRTFRRPVWCGRRTRCPQGGHACGGGAADQLLRSDHRTRQPDRRRARRRACAARPGADHRSGWRSYAEILRYRRCVRAVLVDAGGAELEAGGDAPATDATERRTGCARSCST
jgi:hypothetical protein